MGALKFLVAKIDVGHVGDVIYEGTIKGSDVDYALYRCSWCGGRYYKRVVHWF